MGGREVPEVSEVVLKVCLNIIQLVVERKHGVSECVTRDMMS